MEIGLDMSHDDAHLDSTGRSFKWAAITLGAVAIALLILDAVAPSVATDGTAHGADAHGHRPNMWAIAPFVGILLSIAILPLVPATAHWWENNKNRLGVALAFGAMTLFYYLFAYDLDKVRHVLRHAIFDEYIPFIMLLFSLYVISGGICLKGDMPAHPSTNTMFLAIGALLASFIGTTGASMLLIRPLLQTNSERRHIKHTVIFFIFLVSNVGGCLLPIGDPPLFLGYLRGVPFMWTLVLWPQWLAATVALLIIYFVWDTIAYSKEKPSDIVYDELHRRKLSLSGSINFVWLLGVVLCVALVKPDKPLLGTGLIVPPLGREVLMIVFVALSMITTPHWIKKDNQFNYHAILEVAALFIGIFICMQVPIEILHESGATLSRLIKEPWHFFWSTGSLSSFLDNAPTRLG